MAWMRMPGQVAGAAATFLGMWTVMMVAMMLPAFVPLLLRYRQAPACATPRLKRDRIGGAAYFVVWILVGAVASIRWASALAELADAAALRSRARFPSARPSLHGASAGIAQLSAWKSRQLECCRRRCVPASAAPCRARAAWRHGLALGLRCCACCAPLTARVARGRRDGPARHGAATAAIALERLAPASQRVASLIGIAVIALGFMQLLSAL